MKKRLKIKLEKRKVVLLLDESCLWDVIDDNERAAIYAEYKRLLREANSKTHSEQWKQYYGRVVWYSPRKTPVIQETGIRRRKKSLFNA